MQHLKTFFGTLFLKNKQFKKSMQTYPQTAATPPQTPPVAVAPTTFQRSLILAVEKPTTQPQRTPPTTEMI